MSKTSKIMNMNMNIDRRGLIGGLGAAGAVAAMSKGHAVAQTAYPAKAVRIVVPFAPGGGADLVSRLIAPRLTAQLGQQFLVDNRAGAAGRIGAAAVAKAAPDGHTLLVTTESSLAIAPHIGENIGYDPLKDFAPVSLLTRNVVMLVVHPSVPAATLAEYIALMRAKRELAFFASSGVGGPNHLAGEIFNRMAGIVVEHVPFAGTGLALQAVLGNQVPAMWGFAAGLAGHVRNGRLKAIAVGSKQRLSILPDAAAVAEQGYPSYEAVSWIGMVAPSGVPGPVLDKLWTAVDTAMREPDVHGNLTSSGSEVVISKPDAFRDALAADYAKYSKLTDLLRAAK